MSQLPRSLTSLCLRSWVVSQREPLGASPTVAWHLRSRHGRILAASAPISPNCGQNHGIAQRPLVQSLGVGGSHQLPSTDRPSIGGYCHIFQPSFPGDCFVAGPTSHECSTSTVLTRSRRRLEKLHMLRTCRLAFDLLSHQPCFPPIFRGSPFSIQSLCPRRAIYLDQ